jgi:hypothetical protein
MNTAFGAIDILVFILYCSLLAEVYLCLRTKMFGQEIPLLKKSKKNWNKTLGLRSTRKSFGQVSSSRNLCNLDKHPMAGTSVGRISVEEDLNLFILRREYDFTGSMLYQELYEDSSPSLRRQTRLVSKGN